MWSIKQELYIPSVKLFGVLCVSALANIFRAFHLFGRAAVSLAANSVSSRCGDRWDEIWEVH